MSAHCWCYVCAGRIVTRQTYTRHGRKDKPDEPVQQASLAVDSMALPPEAHHVEHAEDEHKGELSPDDAHTDPLGLLEEVDDSARTGRSKLSPAEVTLLMLDWMCTHKVTDSAAVDLWGLVSLLLPGEVTIT